MFRTTAIVLGKAFMGGNAVQLETRRELLREVGYEFLQMTL